MGCTLQMSRESRGRWRSVGSATRTLRRVATRDLPRHAPRDLDRFAITRKQLGRRYAPELNVELPVRQALAAFARDPEFMRRIADWAEDLDEERHRSLHEIEAALGTAHAGDVAMLSDRTANIPAAMRAASLDPALALSVAEWRSMLVTVNAILDRCWAAMWELRRQSGDGRESTRGLHFAERLREALDRVAQSIDAPGMNLVNTRVAAYRRGGRRQVASARRRC
jgi:hypothetical protein